MTLVLPIALGALAATSVAISLWQCSLALRFPLHRRMATPPEFQPGVSILKPLKGADAETERCLESWLRQKYPGPVQVLFGVPAAEDPAVRVVDRLRREHPGADAQLIVCGESLGANAKVSTLVQLFPHARHHVLVVSDADVLVTPDFVAEGISPLSDPAVGLVSCFYQLGNPATLAMHSEAVAVNADFWGQVLQSRSFRPLDFALGAVMVLRREWLDRAGGFTPLLDQLADDYLLGRRIAARGGRIELATVVAECREAPMGWEQILKHQLRWARTIRVCQPVPYFFSVLGNITLWSLVWLVVYPQPWAVFSVGAVLVWRMASAFALQARLTGRRPALSLLGMPVLKDLLGVAIWCASFLGRQVEWRGQRYRVRAGGRLEKI